MGLLRVLSMVSSQVDRVYCFARHPRRRHSGDADPELIQVLKNNLEDLEGAPSMTL